MFELPIETTFLITTGLVSLGLAVLTFLILIVNRILRVSKRARFQYVKHIGVPTHVSRFGFVIIWLALSMAILFLGAFAQAFQNFTKKELVAEVVCSKIPEDENAMLLKLTPVVGGVRQEQQGFVLQGDQWALEGDILKWDDWMNFAGLHTMYRLTRLRGRYLDLEKEKNANKQIYSLVENEIGMRWQWLYQYGYRLRFVNSVYGSTVYTYPADDKVYHVFVTTSGFSVEVTERQENSETEYTNR